MKFKLFLFSVLIFSSDVIAGSENEWKLIAKSPLIVKGKMEVQVAQFDKQRSERSYDFLLLNVTVLQQYKGPHIENAIKIKYQAKGRSDTPSPEKVLSLNNQDAIFFLEYNDWPSSEGIYFTRHPPSDALQAFNEQSEIRISTEIKKQNELVVHHKNSTIDPKSLKEVENLINDFFDPSKASEAYKQLILLGRNSTPAIINQMSDFRELPIQKLKLTLSPGIYATYKPKVVSDVLAAILNEITGESYGRIYNGGSQRERENVIWGWQVWQTKQKTLTDKVN